MGTEAFVPTADKLLRPHRPRRPRPSRRMLLALLVPFAQCIKLIVGYSVRRHTKLLGLCRRLRKGVWAIEGGEHFPGLVVNHPKTRVVIGRKTPHETRFYLPRWPPLRKARRPRAQTWRQLPAQRSKLGSLGRRPRAPLRKASPWHRASRTTRSHPPTLRHEKS